jgi:hypothetical protein
MNDPILSASGDHITYGKDRAIEWLDSPCRNHDDIDPSHSAADHLGVDEAWWPGTDSDDRLDNVMTLIDRALDEDVILLAGPVNDVDLIETRDKYGNLSGARLLVETKGGVTLANDVGLWARTFVGDETGRDAALAALGQAAHLIDALVSRYRAAEGR